MTVVILRPEPGATATAARAHALGMEPVVAPLFLIDALRWDPPDPAAFDAVLITSANALRHAGAALRAYAGLPGYAVGATTADAMRAAGFRDVVVGPGDVSGLEPVIEAGAHRRLLHLCGRDRRAPDLPGTAVTAIPVYDATATGPLALEAGAAFRAGAVGLIHSPRAGARFAEVVAAAGLDSDIPLAAISARALAAAGPRHRGIVAAEPTDAAVLAAALRLCEERAR